MSEPEESIFPPLPWRSILVHGFLVIGLGGAILKMISLGDDHSLSLDRPELLLPILLLEVLQVVWSALLWRRALQTMIPHPLDHRLALAHVGILLVAKYIPGKLWGLVGRGLHARRLGWTPAAVTTATALEQLAILLSGLLLAVAGPFQGHLAWLLPLLVVTGFVLCPVLRKGMVHPKPWARGPLKKGFLLVEQGSGHLCSWRFFGLSLFALGQWFLSGLLLLAIAMATGVPLSSTLVITALTATPAAILAGFFVLFVPGGIGIREGVLVYCLEPVVGMDAALAIVILFRILDVLRDILMGFWTGWVLKRG
ncbi:MAG: flippase-like domain-containing protein [Magnetococcales bacterium]|nr:flippase-like domain-containing protein [Magnetococcales bacterium]